MLNRTGRVLRRVVALGIGLILAACAGNESSFTLEPTLSTAALTSAHTPTGEPSMPTQDTPPTLGSCETPATEIALAEAVSSEIVGKEQPPPERKYFCVLVPDGTSSLTFELTEATADLNLYVGHPDLATVQQGGLWFWSSNERGSGEKVVVVEPGPTDYVNPGPYYIEVSAEDFRASSPFTLRVHIP